MKKALYFFAACLAFAFTGCESEPDIDLDVHGGKGLEFVHFSSAEDSWLVTSDDESYVYDVAVASTYDHEEDVTYNVKIGEETTGVEGTDFKIANKSVTIKAGEFIGKFPVEVLYATTGEGFVIELELDVDSTLVNKVYGKTAVITVKSDKVTIDWKWLEGAWNAQDYCYYDGKNDGDPYKAAIVKVDETHCIVRNLWGSGADLNATVDFDARTITVPGNQQGPAVASFSAVFYFVAVNPETDYDVYDPLTTPVVGTMSPSGVVFDNYDWLMVGGPYDGYTYCGGEKTTLTK